MLKPWLGVGDHVRDLALAVQHVDRNEDHAQAHAGEKQVEELDAVREVHAEPISAREPRAGERVRHAIGSRVDLAKRERPNAFGRVVLERDAVASADE